MHSFSVILEVRTLAVVIAEKEAQVLLRIEDFARYQILFPTTGVAQGFRLPQNLLALSIASSACLRSVISREIVSTLITTPFGSNSGNIRVQYVLLPPGDGKVTSNSVGSPVSKTDLICRLIAVTCVYVRLQSGVLDD